MLEMEEMQKDPNHVLKAKPGQLLREEKERKRVNKVVSAYSISFHEVTIHFLSDAAQARQRAQGGDDPVL